MADSGGSTDVCCQRAAGLAEQVERELAQLEQSSQPLTPQQHASLQDMLATMQQQVQQAQSLSLKEFDPDKRQAGKQRAGKLSKEHASLQERLERLRRSTASLRMASTSPPPSDYVGASTAQSSDRDRNELFQRAGDRAVPRKDVVITMAEERLAIHRANADVDNFITMGAGMLSALRDQRSTLKAAQRRLLDAANTIGLSQSLLKVIEQRTRQDVWILRGGIVLTLLIMYLAYVYLL